MKQYEKMGFDTEAALIWIYDCKYRECINCEAYPSWQKGECSSRCASGYLLSDVPEPPKVPRWTTAKTQEDFSRLYQGFRKHCDAMGHCLNGNGKDCPYALQKLSHQGGCVFAYLQELVEVPEGR